MAHYQFKVQMTNPKTFHVDRGSFFDLYSTTFEIDEWLEINCTGLYYFLQDGTPARPYLFFKNEQDAILFKLTWC